MLIRKRCFFVVFITALLGLTGCAELLHTDLGKPAPPGDLQQPSALQIAEAVPFWQKQAEQLERLGDYHGACRVIRERYLRSPDAEIGDRFSLLLSYLTDDQVADWWYQESEVDLLCRVTAEYFLRLRRQPSEGLPAASEELLLDLAQKLTSECEVSEDVRAEAQDFLLLHQALVSVPEVTVGCLLPLSGSNAAAGERLLRGMELALGVYPEVFAEVSSGAEVNLSETLEAQEVSEKIEILKDSEITAFVKPPATPEIGSETSVESSSGVVSAKAQPDPGGLSEEAKPSAEPLAVMEESNPSTTRKTQSLPRLRVLFYDTAGEGERARAGVRYLVNEKKVDLLIGPYTGKAANYAAVEAQSLGVTMISLSPLIRNLERYPNVFQHYPTIRNQAVSLAGLAMTRMGLKDFAMLVPKNRYGREFSGVFTDQVVAWGGRVVRQVYYDSSRPDFGPAIRELIGTERYRDFKEKRQEYEAWDKARQRQAEKGGVASEEEDKLAQLAREIGIEGDEFDLFAQADELMPRPLLDCDFEAIVVPDRAQTLKLLIPQLAFYDLEESFLLGGRYWNSPELLVSAAEYADGALFVDALCSDCAGASAELREFQKRFAALYQGGTPGLLETYGFDTIVLIRKLGAKIGSEFGAEIWRQTLAECRNLPLASGLTSTLGDGEIAKRLYPLTFKKGRIESVSDACN